MRALVVVAVVALGCDSTPNVGEECGQNRPVCDEELSCIATYCTTNCSMVGKAIECPEGSICDDVPSLGRSCLRICDDQDDCGRDDVTCAPVTGTDYTACKLN